MIYIRKVATALLVVAASTIVACDGGPTGPTTGSLTVNIPDLPAGVPAAVTVTGPEGIPRIDVAGTRTIPDLTPGTYLVSAAKAVGSRATYTTSAAAQTVEVVASSTPASVTVPYTLATGIVNLAIGGLPSGTNAAVTLFDGKGFFVNLTASGEIVNLEPGEYMIQAQLVTADEVYAGTPSPATISVSASPTPAQAQVTYSATTGSIQFSSSGLPTGAVPAWDITGPGSYAGTISGVGTQVLSRLTPGRYTATARNFDFGAETYGAETRSVAIDVTPGVKVPAAFIYVTRPPTLNVSIDGAYLNQSTQRYNGSVPLVANRAAYVRVFVKANENNSATPKVRVRFYRGGEVISTSTITAPMSTVGLTVSERTTNDSWGVVVPGTVIQPGTSMLVDVDPDNTVREVSEADNAFPASGSPVPLDVRVVPRAEVTFVPIATTANGLVGNVSDARKESLLAPTIGMFPIADYSVDVRAAFTTSAPALQPNDENGAWGQIINEVNTLRLAEGTGRHYVGILRIPYPSGIGGLGFVPGKTTLSYDGAGAPSTVAHELGHNWGRHHAPCGGPSGVDQSYPHAGGAIGAYGFDLASSTIRDAGLRDLMSYCQPEWISDYTYEGVLNHRALAGSSMSAQVSGSVQTSLMVWGRSEGTKLILEPAFLTETRPVLPARNGRYRVEGLDAAGAVVFALSFDPEKVEDIGGVSSEQFAFAIPMSSDKAARIVSMRLAANGREVRTRAAAPQSAMITATAEAGGNVRLDWNSADHPMLVVRDPSTREILAFARGGSARVKTQRRNLDIAVSDRVKSSRISVQVQQ